MTNLFKYFLFENVENRISYLCCYFSWLNSVIFCKHILLQFSFAFLFNIENIWNQYTAGKDLVRQSFITEQEVLSLVAQVNNYRIETRSHWKKACISRHVPHGLLQKMFCSQIGVIEIPSDTKEITSIAHLRIKSVTLETLKDFITINLCNRN